MSKINTDIQDLVPLQADRAITVTNLIDQRASYNLSPPYQRGDVWSTDWKIALINTMIKGIPLAPITLVESINEDKNEEFIVLDGKQRTSSLFSFIDGDFKLPLSINGQVIKLSYPEIEKKSKDNKYEHYIFIKRICDKIRNYNFKAVVYPPINWDQQIELFRTINHSKELSGYDRFNSSFIFAKTFVNNFFAKNIKFCDAYLRDKYGGKKDSTSGVDLFIKFRLMCALTDQNLSVPEPNVDGLPKVEVRRQGDIRRFTMALNDKISQYMKNSDNECLFDDGNEDRVDKMFKEFGWNKLVHNARFFNKVFEMFNILEKKKGKYMYLLFYFSLMLTEYYHDGIMTNNLFEKEKGKIIKVFEQYYAWATATIERTKRSGDRGTKPGSMNDHIAKISELFSVSGIDLGKKYPSFSREEKIKIIKDAGGKCEICGTTDDLEIDHVNPASLSSIKIGGLLCSTHNRLKTDNELDSLDDLKNYMNRKSA